MRAARPRHTGGARVGGRDRVRRRRCRDRRPPSGRPQLPAGARRRAPSPRDDEEQAGCGRGAALADEGEEEHRPDDAGDDGDPQERDEAARGERDASEPSNGAQTAITTAAAASWVAADAKGSPMSPSRPWSAVPAVRPTSPRRVHPSAPVDGGRPTRSESVTTTPSTPIPMPSHWMGRRRSHPRAVPITATSRGVEQAMRAVVEAETPSAMPV